MLSDISSDVSLLNRNKHHVAFEQMQAHYSMPSVRCYSTNHDLQKHFVTQDVSGNGSPNQDIQCV